MLFQVLGLFSNLYRVAKSRLHCIWRYFKLFTLLVHVEVRIYLITTSHWECRIHIPYITHAVTIIIINIISGIIKMYILNLIYKIIRIELENLYNGRVTQRLMNAIARRLSPIGEQHRKRRKTPKV